MDKKDEEFLQRLQATFRIEAEEHIQKLTAGLIELEKLPISAKNTEIVETIFREAHSLKGAARSVNKKDVESICQILESIFGKIKNEGMNLVASQYDLIHSAINCISGMVSGSETKTSVECKELLEKINSILVEKTKSVNDDVEEIPTPKSDENTSRNESSAGGVAAVTSFGEEKLQQSETVRIPTSKLDPLFLQAEEMIQSKIAAVQRISELKTIIDFIETWKKETRKWESHHSVAKGMHLKEIIDHEKEKLDELTGKISNVYQALDNDQRIHGRMIDYHVESMKSILMLPISTIVEGFPKFVRELARSKGKEVELIINGKEVEVDKRILEELKVPLIHLVRNCIDHGIDKPSERKNLNKPAHGKVTLSFNTTESRHIEIIVSDDGSGIELEKVRNAALKTGVITNETSEKLSVQETLLLIFQSGISTSQIITDISGRGLGLAIVREKVEKLGGSVTVESQPKIGTTFRLILPLTLSTLRGVIVNASEHLFVIPTINIERTLRVNSDTIKTVENKKTIMIEGKILTVANLSKILQLTNGNGKNRTKEKKEDSQTNIVQLIVLSYADKKIAFEVDDIVEECQILVKELGKQLSRVRNINGATVLGSGKIVPVINVSDLLKSAINADYSFKEAREVEAETSRQYRILVIDDSITSRTLIKNIVETAGYVVETAVDGIDAFTKALVGKYDLIVSDVDMPRMNGFELTAKIRKEKKLSELPVVLVTALESREDREHGIDVGADAYIVKSSFDQSNLLEVIKKLL